VEAASEAFSGIPESAITRVRYEDFVSDPLVETRRIAEFLDVEHETQMISEACRNISRNSVGKGMKTLEHTELERLRELLDDTLSRLGYV
jgi:hypothetical protein